MANYTQLIKTINDNIKANGNQEITGPVLNAVLQAIVSGMSEGALFAGIADTTTNPPAYDGNVFYIAIEPGKYSNFGVDVPRGSIGVLNNMGGGNKWDVFPINTYYTIDVDTLMQDSPSSDDIDEAIGGLSNLKRAIIAGAPFFGRSASGDNTVAIAQVEQLGDNEVRVVMLNTGTIDGSNELVPIIRKITSSAGQLSLSTEAPTSFIGPLSSLSTNEKGSVVGAINENTGNITRIDRAVGNPTVEEHNFTVAESRKIWTSKGQKVSSSNWFISEIINISKGDAISLKTSGTSGDISAITKVSASGEFINAVVLMNADMDSVYWVADEDSHIQVTIPLSLKDNPYTIIKSPFNTAISDNSYMQYLHKVYEEYGAVYNAETGYWELNGLTDLTEEDMWDIYNASLTAFNSFSYDGTALVGVRYNKIFRTLMDKYPPDFYGANNQYVSAFAAFQGCYNMETLCVGREGSELQLYGTFPSMFNRCSKLRVLKYLDFSYLSSPRDGYEFYACKALKEVRIVKICTDLNFSTSPLIDYESWKYMIENAKGESAITVTVHPTTYSYLTGTAQPTEEVGGTSEEWQALVTTAQGKQISFAQPAETLEVEPLE